MTHPDDCTALVTLLDAGNDLKRLPRTGWLLSGVPMAESVAEHTYAVALLALALAETVNQDYAAHGLAQPLDLGQVMRIALLHDLAESIVTDLPKRTTDLMGSAVKHGAERSAFVSLTDGFPAATDWRAAWDAFESGSTHEARLVRDADKLEMAHQALRYAASGNRNLAEFWQAQKPAQDWGFALCARLHARLIANAPA